MVGVGGPVALNRPPVAAYRAAQPQNEFEKVVVDGQQFIAHQHPPQMPLEPPKTGLEDIARG